MRQSRGQRPKPCLQCRCATSAFGRVSACQLLQLLGELHRKLRHKTEKEHLEDENDVRRSETYMRS